MLVTVHPHSGYEWYDSQEKPAWHLTPPTFQAEVEGGIEHWHGADIPSLRGKVIGIGHPMFDFAALISPRHALSDGEVNVELKSSTGRKLAGLASMDLKSFR